MGVEDESGVPGPPAPAKARPWNRRLLLLLALAAVSGEAAIQVVSRLGGPFLVTCFAMFFVGFACGAVQSGRAWLFGAATVSLVPVVIAFEFAGDRTSHNLLPFELAIYAFLALPGALGAAVGGVVREDAGRPEERT